MQAGIWKHQATGSYYQVLSVGRYSDGPWEDNPCVIYVSLGGLHLPGPRACVRSLGAWEEIVDLPDGTRGPRYTYVGDSLPEEEIPKVGGQMASAASAIFSQIRFRREG